MSPHDQAFFALAVSGAQFEILSGEMAQVRGSDARVKAFASAMVTDHGTVLAELSQAAGRFGVSVPVQVDLSQLSVEKQQILATWNQLTGPAFDCSYAPKQYLDHQVTLEAFQDEAQHGDDQQLRLFAMAQLPTIQTHLNEAGALFTALVCGIPMSAQPIPTPAP